MIHFSCQKCHTKFKIADDAAGKKVRCPKCRTALKVPTAEVKMGILLPEEPPPPPWEKVDGLAANGLSEEILAEIASAPPLYVSDSEPPPMPGDDGVYGLPKTSSDVRLRRRPGISVLLSLVVSGAGQFYNGQIAKGFAFLLVPPLLCFILLVLGGVLAMKLDRPILAALMRIFASLAYLGLWVFNLVDAYKSTNRINLDAEAWDARYGRTSTAPHPPVNSGVAVLLSFFIPGGGQFFTDRIARGFAFLLAPPAVAVAFMLIAVVAAAITENPFLLPVVLAILAVAYVGILIFGMVDAYKIAERINSKFAYWERHRGEFPRRDNRLDF